MNPNTRKTIGITLIMLVAAIIYLPILLLVFRSFSDGLEYYKQLFTTAEYMQAVGNTLLIAVVASLVATIIAAMAATGILYLGKRTRAITMAVNQLPVINADIVTSFGLVLLFVSVGMTNFGLLKLLLAHVLIALPFCLLTILPKMRQLDANLIDAALDLGASPFKAFTSVIVPQLVPAMVQAFLLGFTLSLDDFVITQYNNSGVPTISTVVYGAISRRDIPNAFKALTTIIFIVILIVLVVMNLNAARNRKGIKFSRKITALILAAVLLLSGGVIIPIIVNNLTPRSLVLKVYNWEDYIATGAASDDDLLAEFENYYRGVLADQGVKNAQDFRIEYHTFTDNEELYSKINTQHADYDLIFPSEYMVEKMANEGLIQPMTTSRFMQLGDDEATAITLDENILSRTAAFTTVYDENGNAKDDQVWAVPYMIGTVGIMYDTAVIEAMEETTGISVADFENLLETYGFGVLFGEGGTTAYSGRITMKKSARDSIGIAMIYGAQKAGVTDEDGYHPIKNTDYIDQTVDGEFDNTMLSDILNMDGDYDIKLAREILMDQINTMHPIYENDNGKKSFMNPDDNSFAYGLFWSCDAGLAMMDIDDEATEEYDGWLRYYAPQGTNLWTDNFAIPTYAENLDAAYAFINFMLNAENAARNVDYVGSQMVATGDAVDELKADYGVPGYEWDEAEENVEVTTNKDIDWEDVNLFDPDTNLAVAIFPTVDNITYAAIMHNFTKSKEKGVNNLMLDVQNKAAELTENEGGTVNWFLVAIAILAAAAFIWWLVYRLMHLRPRKLSDPIGDAMKQN